MINEQDIIYIPETTKIRIKEKFYLKFCNQTEKDEKRSDRVVFKTDWQRFLWAFILGLNAGQRTPFLKGEKTFTPFGFDVFKNQNKILNLIIALCLQEMYKDNPSKLKDDFEKLSTELDAHGKQTNLGSYVRIAMEEYANTGFAIMSLKSDMIPGYIENIEEIVRHILFDDETLL